MNPGDGDQHDTHVQERINRRAERKRRARRQRGGDVWLGLGMFGLVGWSVAVPTLVGVALGVWVDTTWPGPHSWTLMLMLPGVVLGCVNAWYWISRERRNIETARRERNEVNDA